MATSTKTPPQLESSSVPAVSAPTSAAENGKPAPGPEQVAPRIPGPEAFATAPAQVQSAPPRVVEIAHSCHTEQIGDLMAALARAQVRLRGALKDAQNPHLRNRYADLASVWNAWQEVGPAEGLALMQPAEASGTFVTVHTHLGHSSGQWMRSTLKLPWEQQKGITPAQAIGSALTYARRYALASLVGVCPEDDDGNAAGNTEGQRPAENGNGKSNGNGNGKHPAVERKNAKLATAGGDAPPDPAAELGKLKGQVWGLVVKLLGVYDDAGQLDVDETKRVAAGFLVAANDDTYPGGRVAVTEEGEADLTGSSFKQLQALRAWLQAEVLNHSGDAPAKKDPF